MKSQKNKVDFSYQQKIAMMRILLDIINADGIIDVRETFFYNQLINQFEMSENDKEVVEKKNSLLALVQLYDMTDDQKDFFANLMAKMIMIDEDVNYNEVAIYDLVQNVCKISKSFEEQPKPNGLSYS